MLWLALLGTGTLGDCLRKLTHEKIVARMFRYVKSEKSTAALRLENGILINPERVLVGVRLGLDCHAGETRSAATGLQLLLPLRRGILLATSTRSRSTYPQLRNWCFRACSQRRYPTIGDDMCGSWQFGSNRPYFRRVGLCERSTKALRLFV